MYLHILNLVKFYNFYFDKKGKKSFIPILHTWHTQLQNSKSYKASGIKKPKYCSSLPKDVQKALKWNQGENCFSPLEMIEALHKASISTEQYHRLWQELKGPKILPGPEIVRRYKMYVHEYMKTVLGLDITEFSTGAIVTNPVAVYKLVITALVKELKYLKM
jgi:hypothetical protein